jgi:hypothetical protein
VLPLDGLTHRLRFSSKARSLVRSSKAWFGSTTVPKLCAARHLRQPLRRREKSITSSSQFCSWVTPKPILNGELKVWPLRKSATSSTELRRRRNMRRQTNWRSFQGMRKTKICISQHQGLLHMPQQHPGRRFRCSLDWLESAPWRVPP